MYTKLSAALIADLSKKGADIERTMTILRMLADGTAGAAPTSAPRIPEADDDRVIDRTRAFSIVLERTEAVDRFSALDLPQKILDEVPRADGRLNFDEASLTRIGVLLYPRTAYGVLNGGSATTYLDHKKNRELSPRAYELLEDVFENVSRSFRDAPKGATPAYLNADGTPGPSFVLLKMRSLALHALEYRRRTGDQRTAVLPFFQMTSAATDEPLRRAYRSYARDPFLAPLIESSGYDPTDPLEAVQPLLAAITHSADGLPRRVFANAWGKADTGIALPGGHGENLRILADTYRALRDRGVKWAYLGNVDNSGFTVDPVSVAAIALRGAEAAFEFSWKTKVDVKGGVLVRYADGRLGVADIGQSIGREEVRAAEEQGAPILFNCATGLFDLDHLVPRLDALSNQLPLRVSDQDKDSGRYAQAEQNTWDILSMIDDPLIFAVKKERRFVAAKMLLENLLTSPVGARVEADEGIDERLRTASARLRRGFACLLKDEYDLSAS